MRSIGMDVHRDFCEVAIAEAGEVRTAGRIDSRVEAVELFAQSLASDDQVVLEATYGAAKIAKLIESHVARVVVCDARRLNSSGSRKTDRRDAKKLAQLSPRAISTRSGRRTRPRGRCVAWSPAGRA